MSAESAQPMSRRDVWLTVALAVAKGEIVPPRTLTVDAENGVVTITYDAGVDRFGDAAHAAAMLGLPKMTKGSTLTSWDGSVGGCMATVYWHPEDKPTEEGVERSSLAEQVAAAIEHLPYNPVTDRFETGGDEIELAEEGPDPDHLEAQADEAADAREYEWGRETSVLAETV